MVSISRIGIHNVFKDNETAFIDINDPVTVLTGYNGVGKSTFLGVVHSTVSYANDGEYLFPRSDWASQVFLTNGRILNHAKIRSAMADFELPVVKSPHKPESLGIFYEDLIAKINLPKKKNQTTASKEGERRDSRSTNFFKISEPSKKIILTKGAGFQSLLYCDELFYFKQDVDQSDRLEELDVFSKKNTLDKTLYLLMFEFTSREFEPPVSSDIIDLIKKVEDMFGDASLPDVIKKQIDEIRGRRRPEALLLDEANIFFNMTGREIFFADDRRLKLRVKSRPADEVEWFNLSKGEKTLLCLLLAVFLNKDNGTVFLFDEPDLSLHIKWQKQLLKSLRNIAPGSQFIISTHSPAMIGNVEGERVINIGAFAKG